MSPGQTSLYFREWGKVRAILVAKGIDPKQADARRHELHKKALGFDKSSKDFTNADLDKVLSVFWSISRPDDLVSQLRQQDQVGLRREEARAKCMEILVELGIGEGHDSMKADWLRGSYLDGLVKKVMPPHVSFEALTDKQANVVLGILVRRVIYQRRAKDKLPAAQQQVDHNCPW